MRGLPEGTVTFLFSDVEGSTQLLEGHGAAMGDALARHHALIAEVVAGQRGTIFETVGDAVYAAFARPAEAVAAALEVHRALAAADWGPIGRLAVRIALHTGQVERRGRHYFGSALFRAARLQALAYGEQTLLSGLTAGLVADRLPPGAALRDLGEHRLKDLGAPERVYQLVHPELRAAFPPLRSLDAHPHNLPSQPTSFVGREHQLAELSELLDRVRLVTLLGPGGVGKTRLALQVAAERLERHPDGVFLIELADLRDPAYLPDALAAGLGLRELPGERLAAALGRHLAPRRMLLVLDNLEHLLPAAAPTLAGLLAAPELRLLVTSRAPLRVRGEHEYPLGGLDAGSGDRLEPAPPPAVALFVERARAIRPELVVDERSGPLIAELCAALDGLPLAIELAAPRLRLFDLAGLRDRLTDRLALLAGGARDLPARQQTLRAAIAWSTELLPAADRRLFARLGVFAGGFELAAAEAVAGGPPIDDVPAGLEVLLEHSLLRRVDAPAGGGPRYAMLDTIAAYAAEQLDALEEAEAVRERHATHVLAAVQGAADAINRGDIDLLRRLGVDLGNERAAVRWTLSAGKRALAVKLMAELWPIWWTLGLLREALAFADEALSLSSEDEPVPERATLLRGAGVLESEVGDMGRAVQRITDSLALARRLDDAPATWRALSTLSYLERDADRAVGLLEESLSVQRRTGEVDAAPLINLGWAAVLRGDRRRAAGLYQESLAVARRIDDHAAAAASLTGLAWMALSHGDPEEAAEHARDALHAARRGDPMQIPEALVLLARSAMRQGDPRMAVGHLESGFREMEGGEWEEPREYALSTSAELLFGLGETHKAATLLGALSSLRARRASGRRRDMPQFGVGIWVALIEPDEWLFERVLGSDPAARAAYDEGTDLDSPAALARARRWVAEVPDEA